MNVYCSLKSDTSCVTADLVADEICGDSSQLKVTGSSSGPSTSVLCMRAELKYLPMYGFQWIMCRCAVASLRVQSTVDGLG